MPRIRILLLACFPLFGQAPPTEAASWNISGRVVNEVDGKPVAKASLTAVSEDRSVRLETTSGADGEFRFSGSRPGRYVLSARHPRYLEARYGARTSRSAGTPIEAEPGGEYSRVEIRMTPPAAISGRVLDDEGEPLAGVPVAVLMRQYQRGRLVWLPRGGGPVSRSDDRGEYRAFGLEPGQYVVAATPFHYFGPQADRVPVAGQAATAYTPVYYPGAPSISGAQVFHLKSGAEVRGIDLFLRKARVYRVRGRVALPEGRKAAGQFGFMPNRWSSSSAPLREDGSFELRNVASGRYALFVKVEDDPPLTIRARVEVADHDIDGLVLEPEPAHAVSGQVRLGANGAREPVTIVLRSTEDDVFFPVLSGSSKPGGAFRIDSVPRGRYRVEVAGGKNLYARSVKADGVEVLDREFDVAGADRLEIALADDVGAVEGEVRRDESPFSGGLVVLAPNGARRALPHYFRFANSDQRGRYRLAGVVPGEYTLLALDGADSDRCHDPEFIAEHESKGLRVTVEAGDAQQMTVSVIEVQ